MIVALVGGQYGSEGKGAIAGHIAREFSVHVRVGAANAGHTVYTKTGPTGPGAQDVNRTSDLKWEKHVMQQIPCAAYANPQAKLVIGPGALISPEIFQRELDALKDWRDQRGMGLPEIFIDQRAHIITDEHIQREQQSDLAERIGSTSTIAREGIGAAQAARVMREPAYTVADYWEVTPGTTVMDTVDLLYELDYLGENILLEGTQGTSLSLTTGQYPYCTSRNTTAAGLAADAGVPPNKLNEVIMVCRSYPIRVAGNSGPFWHDSEESGWDQINVNPENERTTVTKKVRRVATMSFSQLRYNAWLNGATQLALTFADYLDPSIAGGGGAWEDSDFIQFPAVNDVITQMEEETGVPVLYVGTSPYNIIMPKRVAAR